MFLATIAFSACLLVGAVFTPNVEAYMTGSVARRLVRGGEVEKVGQHGIAKEEGVVEDRSPVENGHDGTTLQQQQSKKEEGI